LDQYLDNKRIRNQKNKKKQKEKEEKGRRKKAIKKDRIFYNI